MKTHRLIRLVLALAILALFGSISYAKSPLRVALVLSGGLGDRSFADSAHAGLVRAQKDLPVKTKVLECKGDPSLCFDQLLAAAENHDLVLACPGHQMDKELQELAAQFSNVTFVYVDGIANSPEVVSLDFAEHEGSFLAGALAAMMTKTKVVGMVGILDVPVIRNFLAGYRQGVAAVDPSVKVEVIYVGVLGDPAKGKELTFALHNKGADIVYQVAAGTGEGVIMASKEAGRYAIGVDSDQCHIAPDTMIGSMMKRLDNAIYQTIKYALEGNLKPGTTYTFDIKADGVGMCYCDIMKRNVPKEVIERLKSLENQIRTGEIKVQKGK